MVAGALGHASAAAMVGAADLKEEDAEEAEARLHGGGDIAPQPRAHSLELQREVIHILKNLETGMATAATSAALLKQLCAREAGGFQKVLAMCVDVMLACMEVAGQAASSSSLADTLVGTVVEVAQCKVREGGSPAALHVLCHVVQRLGGMDSDRSLRSKHARVFGARLLGRLLSSLHTSSQEAAPSAAPTGDSIRVEALEEPSSPPSRKQPLPAEVQLPCERVLCEQLARDRGPAIRLAAVAGLVALQTPKAQKALAWLAATDVSTIVRMDALAGLARCNWRGDSCDAGAVVPAAPVAGVTLLAPLPASRVLDVVPAVRQCFYTGAFRTTPEASSGGDVARMLRAGLADVSPAVRGACQQMLLSWLDQRGGGMDALLWLLDLVEVEANEDVAEAVVQALLLQAVWRPVLQGMATTLPAKEPSQALQRLLVWRVVFVATAADDPAEQVGRSMAPLLLSHLQSCLDGGCAPFELRQVLLALASAGPALHHQCCRPDAGAHAAGQDCGRAACPVFAIMRRVLLEAEVGGACALSQLAPLQLALLAMHQAAQCCPILRRRSSRPGPGKRFLEVVGSILAALRAPLKVPDEQPGYDALADRFDDLSADFVESDGQQMSEELQNTSVALGAVTLRALAIMAGALQLVGGSSVGTDSFEDYDPDGLREVWLRPTLERTDVLGDGCKEWATIRALAIRTWALQASLCLEDAVAHWDFFSLVLQKYAPVVGIHGDVDDSQAAPRCRAFGCGSRASGSSRRCLGCFNGTSAEAHVVESCVLFLADTMLKLHRSAATDALEPESCPQYGQQLFDTFAHLLGLPTAAPEATQVRLPSCLRHTVAEGLCTLLLFGAFLPATPAAPAAALGSGLPLPGTLPGGARWALTWLLVEAFHLPLPAALGLRAGEPAATEEEVGEAAHRGRLLRFFGSMSEVSDAHALLLAAACEGILATRLWRLAVPVQLGSHRRWCALQLPRLLRLLSRQLVAAAANVASVAAMGITGTGGSWADGCDAASSSSNMVVQAWLQAIWRPLALACLELSPREPLATCQMLTEALLAALAAVEAASESCSRGSADADPWARGPLLAEVAHVLRLIVARWGCSGGAADPDAPPAAAGGAAPQPAAEPATAAAAPPIATPLLRLANRFALAAGAAADGEETAEHWTRARKEAEERRQGLMATFEELGVDTVSMVQAAREVMYARLGRAGEDEAEVTTSAALPGPRPAAPRPRHATTSASQRKRGPLYPVSDDDSDAPPSPKRALVACTARGTKHSRLGG